MTDSIYTDNIVKGALWNPPYRFIIMQVGKPPTKTRALSYVAVDAADAYSALSDYRENNVFSFLYDYILVDSFHEKAEDFCKKKFEEVLDEANKRIF